MRILYITPFFNFPPQDGASLRTVRLYEKLVEKNEVDVITYFNDGLKSHQDIKSNSGHFYFFSSQHKPSKNLSFFQRLFSKTLPGFSSHDPLAIGKDIEELNQKNGGYDIYYFATQLMGQAINSIKKEEIMIIDLYDVYATYSRSKIERLPFWRPFFWLFYFEAKRIRNFEKKILSQFDHILVTCKENFNTVYELLPNAAIHEIPNGVNWPSDVKIRTGDSLLMVANFNYAGNEEGINWFFDLVWPIITEKNNNLNLTLVGKYPERLKNKTKNESRVLLTGSVPTLNQYYENAACVILPLFNDGGTKTKLLEAMAYGVPIVSTSIGAKGFQNGSTIKVADKPKQFAQSILNVIDQDINEDALLRGCKVIKDNFTWEKIGDKLNNTLPTLIKN